MSGRVSRSYRVAASLAWLAAMVSGHAACLDDATIRCGQLICPANQKCAPSGQQCIDEDCGDGVVGGGEDCEPGLDVAPTTCENFGFYAPQGLSCAEDCSFDTTGCELFCGDGQLQADSEDCEGDAPRPGSSCAQFGFERGPLGCLASECAHDLSHCGHIGFYEVSRPGIDRARAIHGTRPDNIFIAGENTLEHYDGLSWAAVPDLDVGDIRAVWAQGQVVVIGGAGTLAISADGGTSFADVGVEVGDLVQAVFGASDQDLWSVGHNFVDGIAVAWHFDGTSWTRMEVPSASTLTDVWAKSSGQAVAVGTKVGGGAAVWRFDAGGWVPEDIDGTAGYALWGSGDSDLWIATDLALVHFDGSTYSPSDLPIVDGGYVVDLYGLGATDVYALGNDDYVYHYDGQRWLPLRVDAADGLISLWVDDAGTVYTSGYEVVHVGEGAYYERTLEVLDISFQEVYAASADEALAVGSNQKYSAYRDGTWEDPVLASGHNFRALWGRASNDAWSASYSTPDSASIQHFDGLGFTDVASVNAIPGCTPALWGFADGSVFVVSGISVKRRTTGGSWVDDDPGLDVAAEPCLLDVWGTSPTDVWAVGKEGTVVHYDGTAWTVVASAVIGSSDPFDGDVLSAIWGSAADDIWVGGDSVLYHFDGASWNAMDDTTFARPILALSGTRADDIFAVSGRQLAHYDGDRWATVKLPVLATLLDVWALPDRVFVVGHNGAPTGVTPSIIRTRPWSADE